MRIFWPVFFLLLAGCTVGPDFERPDAPRKNQYEAGGDPDRIGGMRFGKGKVPAENWWKVFGSAELDRAVEEGMARNPTVQAAQESLKASEENLRAGYGIFYPQVGIAANPARQKFSPARFGSNAPASLFNLITLSASVSYALDLFGGEKRSIENLESRTESARQILSGTYLSLTGNIVNTVIAVAAYRSEIAIGESLVSLQKEEIAIAEKQVEAGVASGQSLLPLKSQLDDFEASLPPLRQKRSAAEHLLATLEGREPAEGEPSGISFDALAEPSDLPLSLPSEVVKRRPDILAAEADLHAASANIGVATAALFPSFALNANYGQNAGSMNGLFGNQANFWSLGANVAAPVFNGGTLVAQKREAVAAYRQSLAQYRQTVLSALAQVADSIRALQHDEELVKAESRSVGDAKDALHLAQVGYRAGTSDYLQAISARIRYQQARSVHLQALAQRFQDITAYFVSLGGSGAAIKPRARTPSGSTR